MLAKALSLSPQNTSLILRGVNNPNSETTLQILEEILDENHMNKDEPKTLFEARETLAEAHTKIADLTTRLAQLQRGRSPNGDKISISPKPTTLPAAATPPAPVGTRSGRNIEMRFNPPAPRQQADSPPVGPGVTGNFHRNPETKAIVPKQLPATAVSPVLVQRILDVSSIEDVASMLSNPAHSKMQRAVIYNEMRLRRRLAGGQED
jgi:hypothetical protein